MKRTLILLAALTLGAALTWAKPPEKEGGGPGGPRPGGGFRGGPDPMMANLFPPPVIHEAGKEIGLTEEQEKSIKEELDKTREQFEELQENVREAVDALNEVLKAPHVDEGQATARLNKVLAAESEIKKAHLASLIRIKNILTPEQQEKLREFMKEHRPPGPPFGPGGGQGQGFGPRGPQGPPPPNE